MHIHVHRAACILPRWQNFEREEKRLGGHKTKKLKVKSSDMNLKILDMIC